VEVVSTVDVVLTLIRAGVLDVAAADGIKDAWAQHHRFRIKVASFRDLL
jgi:hypothetical protein